MSFRRGNSLALYLKLITDTVCQGTATTRGNLGSMYASGAAQKPASCSHSSPESPTLLLSDLSLNIFILIWFALDPRVHLEVSPCCSALMKNEKSWLSSDTAHIPGWLSLVVTCRKMLKKRERQKWNSEELSRIMHTTTNVCFLTFCRVSHLEWSHI